MIINRMVAWSGWEKERKERRAARAGRAQTLKRQGKPPGDLVAPHSFAPGPASSLTGPGAGLPIVQERARFELLGYLTGGRGNTTGCADDDRRLLPCQGVLCSALLSHVYNLTASLSDIQQRHNLLVHVVASTVPTIHNCCQRERSIPPDPSNDNSTQPPPEPRLVRWAKPRTAIKRPTVPSEHVNANECRGRNRAFPAPANICLMFPPLTSD